MNEFFKGANAQNENEVAMTSSVNEAATASSVKCPQLISLSQLSGDGCKIAYLAINRPTSDRNIKKKLDSIKKVGRVIVPSIIATAKECIKAGLIVVDEKGNELNENNGDISNVRVVIDGQHRLKAVLQHNANLKDGESPIDCYFLLVENVDIVLLLREANVATTPWKGGDYLTNLIFTCKDKGVDLSKILWVQQRFGTCGDSASWLWANFSNKIVSKSEIIKATEDAEKGKNDRLKAIADTTFFEYGSALFEVSKTYLGTDLVKLKVLPLTLIEIIETDSKAQGKDTVVESLKKFLATISADERNNIQSFKKTQAATKDSQISARLKSLWGDYKKANNI